MNIPAWVKLAAASQEELLEEVKKAIDELGGVDKAQEALRQMASEKTSNWVLTERFIVSKSLDQLLNDVDKATRKNWEDSKIVEKPAPVEPEKKKEVPEQEVSTEEPIKTEPQKLPQVAYLAMLLGLLMGTGVALTPHQLRNVDLRELLDRPNQGPRVPSKVPSDANIPATAPAGVEPQEAPEAHDTIPEEDLDAMIGEYRSQLKMREQEIAKEKNPEKKKAGEASLDEFKESWKNNLSTIDPKALKQKGLDFWKEFTPKKKKMSEDDYFN